jgi:hypothetical protein
MTSGTTPHPPRARPDPDEDDDLPRGFDGLQYLASNGDLIPLYGADVAAGERHYLAFGRDEGRDTDNFDEGQYLENYPDLRAAFGDDTEAATVHYIEHGYDEGRRDEPEPEPAGAAAADFLIG